MVIFEVCAYLFKSKDGDPPKADQPQVRLADRGLEFEPDAEIG